MPRADLAAFASALAQRLPGTWTARHHPHTTEAEQFPMAERLWDNGHAAWAISTIVLRRHAVLTGPDDLQLYVIDRPAHQAEFLVAPVIPADINPRAAHGIIPPSGIAVPADPARAASLVARRLLPRYRTATAQAREQAGNRPGWTQVVFALRADGNVRVTAAHPTATALLRQGGFHLDPVEDAYVLPHNLDPQDKHQRIQTTALQLGAAHLDVSIRRAPDEIPQPDGGAVRELTDRVSTAHGLSGVAAVLDEAVDPATGPLLALDAFLHRAGTRAVATAPAVLRQDIADCFDALTHRARALARDLANIASGLRDIDNVTHAHGPQIWAPFAHRPPSPPGTAGPPPSPPR